MTDIEKQAREIEMTRSQLLTMTLLVEGGMLLVGVVIALWRDASFWSASTVTLATFALGCAASIPPLLIIIGVTESNTRLGVFARENFDPVIALFENVSLRDIAFVSIMAGVCEEALFRGALQVWAADLVGIWAALVIISILFGLVHFLSWSYLIFATIIGIYLGLLYIWSGSLLVPVTAHAVYDFVALIYGTRFMRHAIEPAPLPDSLETPLNEKSDGTE